jgi:hypothetical protein
LTTLFLMRSQILTLMKRSTVWSFNLGSVKAPKTGELFFLRMMSIVVKRPTSYEVIRKVAYIQYFTFRDVCFHVGFLGDIYIYIYIYIGAIREALGWRPEYFLRNLFAILLLCGTMNRPYHVF